MTRESCDQVSGERDLITWSLFMFCQRGKKGRKEGPAPLAPAGSARLASCNLHFSAEKKPPELFLLQLLLLHLLHKQISSSSLFIMAGPARPASAIPARRSNLRQPTRRAGSAVPERHGSPAVSTKPTTTTSNATTNGTRGSKLNPDQSINSNSAGKRKERDYEREINEDTSIHVVVRCRGRNEREVKENSGVVLSTPEGVNGKTVELSMGPNALSNKAYAFDKVFSPAADQTRVFEDTVLPIVHEV